MSFFLENSPIENGYYSIPDLPTLGIVGNLPVTATLSYIHNGSTVNVFNGSYYPANNRVEIDFKDVLSSLLYVTDPQFSADNFVQSGFIRNIKLVITDADNSIERNFNILNINARCQQFNKRFLTLQPDVKATTAEAAEFLTYFYTGTANKLVVRFYDINRYEEIVTLYVWDKTEKAVTHNVSPAIVLANSNLDSSDKLPFYDIYVVNDNNVRISSVQRYVLREATELDRYYLSYNSLGGLDTLIASGSLTEQPEISFDIARISSGLTPIDIGQDHSIYNQTGNLESRYASFVRDFIFSKRNKYLYQDNALTRIVMTGSDTEFVNKQNILVFAFSYRKNEDIAVFKDIDVNAQQLIMEDFSPEMPISIPKKKIIVHNDTTPCTTEPIECTMSSVVLHVESYGTIKVYTSTDKSTWTLVEEAPGNGLVVSMTYEDIVVGSWLKVESDSPITHIEAIFSNADHTLMIWSNDDDWNNKTIWN